MAISVKKGSLTIVSSVEGISVRTKNFQFNPAEINDMKSTNWGASIVAGVSHPVYQYGSGGERLISFELYLDADRSNTRINGLLNIAGDLAWYRSLIYPASQNTVNAKHAPTVVSFSLGELYKSVYCVVKQADIKVTYFAPDMRPIRGTVVMQLAEIVPKSQTTVNVSFGNYGPNDGNNVG